MKLLAYAAPVFAMAFLIVVALLITGCTELIHQRSPLSNHNDTGWTCIGNCNGDEKNE